MRGQFAANPWITCSQSQGSPQPIRRQLAGKHKTACSQSLGNTCSQSQDTYFHPVTGHPAAGNRLHVPSPTGARTACSQSQDTYLQPVTGHPAAGNRLHVPSPTGTRTACSQSQDTYFHPVTGHPAAVNRLHVPSPTGTRTACSQSQDTYFHPVTGHSATVNSCHIANCGRNEVQDKSHILTQQTVGGTRYKTNHTSQSCGQRRQNRTTHSGNCIY